MLDQLTSKQTEVLDLLLRHLTTKEIARELNLAPNTVDQRIASVRDKWGTLNRKDTVRQYTELQAICGKTTYGSEGIDEASTISVGEDVPSPSEMNLVVDPPSVGPAAHSQSAERTFGLQLVDERLGKMGRWALVFIFAATIAVTIAATLAIADSLGRML